MSNVNTILIGDSVYEVTDQYKAGAKALRDQTPFHCNPHRDGSRRHDDWSYGHDHEAADFHMIDGEDVILAKNTGREFTVPCEVLKEE